jgi:TonB-dependent SusC/RagA subfamily outer membrane receptor
LPEQALVVRHERSHVVARDPLLLMTGVALAVLQPWNPFAWLLVSRLRLAIELDCDRRLLAGGTSPRDYGDLLIALAGAASPAARPPLLHPMFSLHTSHLAQRILAMTERPVRLILARRLAVASLAAVALVAACESKLPTDAEIRDMDAETAVRSVAGVAALDPAQVRYIVDGSLVETEVAKAIPAERIGAVSVQNGKSEVYITTLDRAPGQPSERASIVERRVEGRPLDASIVTRDSASGASIVRRDGARAEEFTGLVILDGVRSDIRMLRELPPDRIESVSVVKGAAALAQYGEAGANGVIVIKTKPRR